LFDFHHQALVHSIAQVRIRVKYEITDLTSWAKYGPNCA